MKTFTTLILTATAIATLGLGGLAKLVHADSLQPKLAVTPTQTLDKSDGDGETNDDAKELQESQTLQSLAKITPQQAQKAAEASVQGTASSVKLENENGSLVYTVAIGQTEVIIDAGNGKVLDRSTPNSESNEKTQPRSSIQVSQPNGDGDSETNDDR